MAVLAERIPHSRSDEPRAAEGARTLVRWFADLSIEDVPSVGGKNASLGEMFRELHEKGVKVPNGFATTADAFRLFLRVAGLDQEVRRGLSDLDVENLEELRRRSHALRQKILLARLPEELERQILEAYDRLSDGVEGGIDVAVRSSATAEDLPQASFAGQQETYLNVRGHGQLLDACRRCFASLFTDRAISYRVHQGFDHFAVALSVGVQRMVRSDLAAAGVIFTLDTETGFRDVVLVNSSYGLGETVVKGAVNPDEFYVFKPTLAAGKRPILSRKLGSKAFKLIYAGGGGAMTRSVPVEAEDRCRLSLGDDDVLTLARWACLVEDHYSTKNGRPTPMDLEWAK
ncbi:MAG: phosphoenolpyruvate synthase, partial [Acidobacteria bacterium]|nr:phosphoenolpyruvate synthase [Acidobacteriota bacterium]